MPKEWTLDQMLSYVMPVIISVCALSCASSPSFPSEHNGEVIYFGDGGGFTGAVTEFALLDNGSIFEKSPADTAFHKIGTVKRNVAVQVLDNYYFQNLNTININVPGNRYYFLNRNNHKIVYDPYAKGIPQSLSQYIHTLNGLVRKIKKDDQ